MILHVLSSHDPYLNLAIEEYLFLNSDDDVFMLWQNEPTVVIGRNQNVNKEVNISFVKENDIKIARRITGGGAVYHDMGNVNYTFISQKGSSEIDFETFSKPILDALSSMGIDATLSGRNDLLTSDGKKFSGNAQRTEGGRVLHHGTLLFSSDLTVLSSAIFVDDEKIKSKAIKSVRSRVANLCDYIKKDISTDEFIGKIVDFVSRRYGVSPSPVTITAEIENLRTRNESFGWIYPNSDFLSSYTVQKKQRYSFGIVELFLNMKNTVIADIKIRGDFFGSSAISSLENILVNTDLSELCNKLHNIEIGEYIYGMTLDDLCKLILD